MKIILHCGFPKTGTTALQKWASKHVLQLERAGISYPRAQRDHEGYGHHLLSNAAITGPKALTQSILSAAAENNLPSVFLSAEGLANQLSRHKDITGNDFFRATYDQLSAHNDVYFIFTLRGTDQYLKSIAVQNILYDQESRKPSEFATHTLNALTRSYESLHLMAEILPLKFLEHSQSVNQSIVSYVHEISGATVAENINTDIEHISSDYDILLFFMWLNIKGTRIPADLHSFLRFHPKARENLQIFYSEHMIQNLIQEGSGVMQHVNNLEFALSKNNQFLQDVINTYKNPKNACQEAFKSFARKNITHKVLQGINELEILHAFAGHCKNDSYFSTLLTTLIADGSSEYGQPFGEQLTKLNTLP